MSVVKKGNTGVTIVSINRTFDPQFGPQTEIVYQGFEGPINTTAALATAAGAKSRVTQFQGPAYRASVTYGDLQDGSAEIPVDHWERTTEYVQADIWSNPLIQAAAGYSADLLATWKSDIDGWLATKPYKSPSTVTGATERGIYELILRGGQSDEIKRFVLRKRRTYSLGYASVATLNANESVYITDALVAAFAVPAAIPLPPDPAAGPTNTVWAWKERQNNAIFIPAYNRVEEVRDWVFAAWSTLLYNVIS